MNGQQLKNSILQMAVQGKLVPQDPNDEPASVLIQRIREEKEKLIKEKKIKKEKNPSYIFRGSDNLHYEKVGDGEPICIEDLLPFEIPDSWEWVRLNKIVTLLGDGIHGTPLYDPKGNNYFINGTNIKNDRIIITDNTKLVSDEEALKHSRTLCDNTLLVSINGTLGNVAYYKGENIVLGKSVCYFNLLYVYKYYIGLFLKSFYVQEYLKKSATGSTIKNVPLSSMRSMLVPIPPIGEQKRIVAKIEQILPHIREYELSESRIGQLNAAFPEQLKKSILQEAVQGKLVPQDPSDEPANVLLERIREEKARLVKEGKIKKDKNESVIFRRDNSYYEKSNGIERCIDEELPFEIPDSWEWRRLCCCVDVRDGTHDSPKYVQEGIPLITSKNLHDGYLDMKNAKFISQEDHEKISQRSRVDNNDILFAMIGSIGNPVLYNGEDNRFSIKNMALFKHIHNGMLMKYVYWWLFFSQYAMKTDSSGGVQSFVSLNYLRNYFIPVPPLAEQQRIVTKIEQLLAMIKSF